MKKIKRLKHIDNVADQWIQISMRGLSVYDRYEIDGCTGHVKSVNVVCTFLGVEIIFAFRHNSHHIERVLM